MPNAGGISAHACGDSGWLRNGWATGRKQQGDEGCNVPYYTMGDRHCGWPRAFPISQEAFWEALKRIETFQPPWIE